MGYQRVNFSDVEEFEPMPEGEYSVEIDKVEVRKNKAGDGEYFNWEMVVLDGDYENRRLWMITSLKPQALFRLKQVLEGLDLLEDEDELEIEYDDDVPIEQKSGPRLLYPEVEGLEATATVSNRMYDGREQNEVKALVAERRVRAKTKKRSTSSRRDEEDEEDEAPRRSSRKPARSEGIQRRRRVR